MSVNTKALVKKEELWVALAAENVATFVLLTLVLFSVKVYIAIC
jgi:hypothetical protein